jgi:formate-dependent nitrite reductase membrane component NrfD
MSTHKHVWTWPIATYLFLGGLGAGMTVVAAGADFFLDAGGEFALCVLAAVVVLGAGSALLIFELGRPWQFWRVFSRQKAVLTFGAWMVIALVVVDILYFSFLCGWFPWGGFVAGRIIVAWLGILLSCGVLIYTGVELSSMRARVFWNTPVLPVLFVSSGLLVGSAADYLLLGIWPSVTQPMPNATATAMLLALMVFLVLSTLFITMLYVLMMYTSAGYSAQRVAKRWLVGRYALVFWAVLVAAGLVAPLVLLALGDSRIIPLAALLTIVGGVCLRFLVVYSDDRRQIEGEVKRLSRLPRGDEDFLRSNWG